jgi:hypothetical protein
MIAHQRSGAAAVVAALALVACGCGTTPEPQRAAERFMESYYAQSNVAEAVTLCAGSARTRLEGELAAIQGVPTGAADQPRISFALAGDPTVSATAATYTYRVTAHTADVGVVTATLGLSHEGGRWLVTSLAENENAPAS